MAGERQSAFNHSMELLRSLPEAPEPISATLNAHIIQISLTLERASELDLDEKTAQEMATVAQTCMISAFSLCSDVAVKSGDTEVQNYLGVMQALIETWPIRELTKKSSKRPAEDTADGSPSSRKHQAAAVPSHSDGSDGSKGGEANVPPPPPTAEDLPDISSLNINPIDKEHTAEVLYRFGLDALDSAEQAVIDRDKMTAARSFHCAVIYLESLRIFGKLQPEVEAKQRYAHWRCRQFSHLVENFLNENVLEKRRIQDVYELDDEGILGSGSYGQVVVATHRLTREKYACKQLNLNRATPRYVSKLYHEVAIMRELNHPHIVKLHEVFYHKRRIYLIMELAMGGELFEFLTSQPGDHFDEWFAANLFSQMLSAVYYIHSKGVVHRDLKLENFLLEERPDMADREACRLVCVKLIDFGLSKHFHHHEIMSQQVGSAYYVAPEVLRGQYTEASCDMWSMGVILYMLVSGIPPFWGKSDREIRHRIVKGRYTFPDKYFGKVSDSAKDLISKLLCMDPRERWTAEQALQHPWLKANEEPISPVSQTSREVVSSLRQFTDFSLMRRLMHEVIAFTLSTHQLNELRSVFEQLDADKNGSLSVDEMRVIFSSMDEISDEDIEQIFEAVSVHKDHTINYNEFIAATMWKRIHMDEERLHQAFDTLDAAGDGFLTLETIQNAVGQDFTAEEVAQMVAECDYNGDGKVDYAEFERLWKTHQLQLQNSSLAPFSLKRVNTPSTPIETSSV